MHNRPPDKDPRPRSLVARLDRAARDMNVFLLVFAIGLATLDLTCLWAFELRDAMPTAAHTAMAAPAASNEPAPVKAAEGAPNHDAGAPAGVR